MSVVEGLVQASRAFPDSFGRRRSTRPDTRLALPRGSCRCRRVLYGVSRRGKAEKHSTPDAKRHVVREITGQQYLLPYTKCSLIPLAIAQRY